MPGNPLPDQNAATQFDVIVVGGGPTGMDVAMLCQSGGLRVALVERELVGGECHYWGCIPSKSLLRPREVLDHASRVPGAREAIKDGIDAQAALARRDANADHWDDAAIQQLVEEAGVEVVRGHGRLVEERVVEVESGDGVRRLTAARAVVLATGSTAAMPPINGLQEIEPWDNRRGTDSTHVPHSLLVLGGGAVGVELAQAWKSLGTEQVVLVERSERLLQHEEPFASEIVAGALRADGIQVHTGAMVSEISRDPGGKVHASLSDGTDVTAEEVLVATGRRPRTEDLGLDSVGLKPGEWIDVDDHGQVRDVAGQWLYAIADTTGKALMTHMGRHDARAVATLLTGGETASTRTEVIPRVTFSEPQVGAVGLTEAQARQRGFDIRLTQGDLAKTPGAAVAGEDVKGVAQLVIDRERDVILGATFVASDAALLMHAATVAIVGQVPVTTMRRHVVPPFPTVLEVWLELLDGSGTDS